MQWFSAKSTFKGTVHCGKAKGSMTKNIGPLTSPPDRNDATRFLLINFILGKNRYKGSVMSLNQGR